MITEVADPQKCPGGYSLDAYCKYENPDHGYDEFPHQAYGQTYTQCVRDLKRAGWIMHKDDTGTCPKCAKALKDKSA